MESLRARVFRFGAFKLDVRAGELRKHDIKIRLQEQPLRILLMLLEHPGEVVSREATRQAWTEVPLLSPGIRLYNYPGHPSPISQGQFIRFDGSEWVEVGDVLDAD